jgi:excisionase family DNA binding protein
MQCFVSRKKKGGCLVATSKAREFYRSEEVAEIFAASSPTVRRWIAQGKIKGRKIGRNWLVHKDEVERLKRVLKGEDCVPTTLMEAV